MSQKKLFSFIFLGVVLTALIVPVAEAAIGFNTDPASVNINDTYRVLRNVINFLLGFAAVGATVFLIIGAFNWIGSGGSAERIQTGKTIIKDSIIGLLMIILAAVLVNTIIGLIGR